MMYTVNERHTSNHYILITLNFFGGGLISAFELAVILCLNILVKINIRGFRIFCQGVGVKAWLP